MQENLDPIGKTGKIYLNAVNAKTVRVTGPGILDLSPTLVNNEIVKLVSEDYTFSKEGIVRPKAKSPYKINVITKAINTNRSLLGYDLSLAQTNLSSIFAAPLLGGNRDLFLWDTQFVNAFIGTPEDQNVICLLYRFSPDNLFLKFENALQSFRTFKYKKDTDSYHVLFVFDVPEMSKSSYEKLVESEYSKMDDVIKLKILDYHKFSIDGHTGKVLFKSDNLRRDLEKQLDCTIPSENELHSKLRLDQEIFNPEYYYTPKSLVELKTKNVKST
jgi:hypothetical protein